MPSIFHGSWASNSGPQACVTSTLLNEPSPQSLLLHFELILLYPLLLRGPKQRRAAVERTTEPSEFMANGQSFLTMVLRLKDFVNKRFILASMHSRAGKKLKCSFIFILKRSNKSENSLLLSLRGSRSGSESHLICTMGDSQAMQTLLSIRASCAWF